jgi:hypothetical protein
LQRQLPKQIRISYQANLAARLTGSVNSGNHLVDDLLRGAARKGQSAKGKEQREVNTDPTEPPQAMRYPELISR